MSEIQNELISVILPVYNVEQYLNECINSLLLQTYSNLEIILVDDGSTDGSGKVCDEWKYKDKRIRVIHKKNEGVSVARNIGIDASTGKYIGFIDSDDAVAPEFYEKLYHAIMAESADLAVTHEIIWDGGQIQKTACTSQNGKGECLEGKKEFLEHFLEPFTGNIGWVWNKLYSRDLIGSSRFIRVKNMEDVMFNAEIALKVKHAVWICDRLYYYRQREGSVCGCGKNNRILEEMNGQKYIHQLFMNESDDFGKKVYSICIKPYGRCMVEITEKPIFG